MRMSSTLDGMPINHTSPKPKQLTCACQPGRLLRAGCFTAARLRQRRDLRTQAPRVHRHLQHRQVLRPRQHHALCPPSMPAHSGVPAAACCGGWGAFCLRSPRRMGPTSRLRLYPCCRVRPGAAQECGLCGAARRRAGRQRAQVGDLPPQQPSHRARERLGRRHCRWLSCPLSQLTAHTACGALRWQTDFSQFKQPMLALLS